MFKTLLVDDNDSFRHSLRAILSRHFPFMQIDEAATGAEAMQHDSEHQLVFMDIRLPDTNGLELTRRLKATHPGSLVCVFTQYDIPEYREAANQSGASEFILKDSLSEAAIVGLVDSMLVTRGKVLIVEDDEKFRVFLCHLFDDCWPEVVVAHFAWSDMPDTVTGFTPDMVLLEPRSGSEGLELLGAISSEYDNDTMVIVASSDRPELREWAHSLGIRRFILKKQKVFDELVAAIGAQLHQPNQACRSQIRGRSSRKRR